MEPLIRERAGKILDSLPIGEAFDWVDLVSKELTTQTLATLFDFPFEERRKLTYWSDIMTTAPGHGPVEELREQKRASCVECLGLLHASCGTSGSTPPPGDDLISMLAHGEATAEHGADGVPRQRHAADRRRQRHHPQHHLRRRSSR